MTMQRTLRMLPVLSVLLPASLTIPTTGWSQVEEIVVTARRREESLQDVPLQIIAFSEENIERRGIDGLEDIIKYTPGVTLDEGFSAQDQRVVIRGLSPTRGRPNVAFLLDDVDISSEAIQTSGSSLLINQRLFDLERVEVVKGPQSALYGRSAFGGAIHYITKKPGDTVEGRVGLDIGSDGMQELTASLMGPIVEDVFSAGINFATWSHDGFYNNSVTGDQVGDTEGFGVAASAVLKTSDTFRATARIEYTDDEFGQQAMASVAGNTVTPVPVSALGTVVSPGLPFVTQPVGTVPSADSLVIAHSPSALTGSDLAGVDREIIRGQLRVDFDLDFAEFSSITHITVADTYQEIDTQRTGDVNNPVTGSTGGVFRIQQDNTLISQEFRLTSQSDGPFSWVLGGLIWDEDSETRDRNTTCLILIPTPGFPTCGDFFRAEGLRSPIAITERQTEHQSIYGLFEWEVNDQWTLHFEGRFATEDLTVVGANFGSTLGNFLGFPIFMRGPPPFPPGTPLTVTGDDDDDFFAPKFFVEWEATDDINIYGSVARAVKPGGISTIGGGAGAFNIDESRFEAEELTAYELGLKSLWAEGTFQFNAALFFQDFDEKQASTQVPLPNGLLGTRPVNAAKAEVLGLEFDAVWAPNDNWTLALSYSYLDTEYKDFLILNGGVGPISANNQCTVVTIGMATTCQIDLSGNPIEDIPENSLQTSITYQRPLNGQTDWFVQFDAQYIDERKESETYHVFFEDYWLADLRAGLSGDTWDVTLYVDNVFDDDTVKTGFLAPDFRTFTVIPFPPPFTVALTNSGFYKLPDPRTWGLRASFRFGE